PESDYSFFRSGCRGARSGATLDADGAISLVPSVRHQRPGADEKTARDFRCAAVAGPSQAHHLGRSGASGSARGGFGFARVTRTLAANLSVAISSPFLPGAI